MKINIRGDKVLLTDSIKEYVTSKLNKAEKYFGDDSNISVNVVVRVRGRDQIIEVTIPTKHFTLRAEESHNDLYAAIDLVIDKIERQIRKNKTRIAKKLRKEASHDFKYEQIPDMETSDLEEKSKIVKRKKLSMKPMNEEEAILQMNLLSHDFFIYKDSDTGNICVLYKRKDDNYGLIEAE